MGRLEPERCRRAIDGGCLFNWGRADYAVLSELSKGLSGGDILNVCVNAIHAGSVDADPAKWKVTQAILEREIAKAKKAKAEHSGEKAKSARRIGFLA
jgi:hypothetical protein